MRGPHLALFPVFAMLVMAGCDEGANPTPVEPDTEADASGSAEMAVEGYPTDGEIGSGWIFNRYGQAVEVQYEIHDDLAIWQGDIILGRANEVPTTQNELISRAVAEGIDVSPDPDVQAGVVILDATKFWPDGVVPFTNSDADINVITDAVQMIEEKTAALTLVPWSGEPNYVKFQDADGCASFVGMQGGEQLINLKVGGCSAGSAAHEILHSVGMYHEHTRCDRDNYIFIDWLQIEDGEIHNFEIECAPEAIDLDRYDFGSLMHYGPKAYAIGTNPTIIPRPGFDASAMGQRDSLGPTDVTTLAAVYGSSNDAPLLPAVYPDGDRLEGSTLRFDASAANGTTDPDDAYDALTFAWTFGDGTCTTGSPPAACFDDAPGHVYADDGSYGYTVIVSDGLLETGFGSNVTIDNVEPEVEAGDDATVDEGSPFHRSGAFRDPGADSWVATVDYGDGGGPGSLALSGRNFSLAHTYADDGINTVVITVTDDDDGVGSDDADVTVLNVAPTVDAGPDATVESGQTFDFSGTFGDPGTADSPWLWVIDWDVAPTTTGQALDPSVPIAASRRACLVGTHTVTLTVTDKDGASGSDALTLTVPYAGIEIDVLPGSLVNPVNLRSGGSLPVAVLGSADLDAASIDPASLTLGDGSSPDTPVGQKPNGTYGANLDDVNLDGYIDLVALFPVRDLVVGGELEDSSKQLVLSGFLADGCTNIRSSDSVTPR